jgi:hypothetical protein
MPTRRWIVIEEDLGRKLANCEKNDRSTVKEWVCDDPIVKSANRVIRSMNSKRREANDMPKELFLHRFFVFTVMLLFLSVVD